MPSYKFLIPGAVAASLICVAVAQKPQAAAEPPKAERSAEEAKKSPLETFMRKKLDASSRILEGLCQEDAAMVKEGADMLGEMSKAEVWNVLTDADYREHSREFRDSAARVAKAAEDGDFDKAALRWFDVTMSCLECHNHVRSERKADKK
jgi:hypothetical protein